METNFRRKPVCRHKICKRARYRSFKYCYQHILNDPTAPFSTCQYVSNITKRKCPNPALISDRINSTVPCLCEIHNNAKSGRLKYRSHRKKYAKLAERDQHATLFQKLGKYRKGSGTSEDPRHHCDEDNAPSYDNALGILEQDIHENQQWVTGLSSSWKSGEADIDVDLVEDLDNPLKYAGVYTAEEVISMSKQRLVRLQSLYIDQFKHLHGTLLERRRKYLVDKSMEEQQGSSTSNAQLSRSDQHHLQDLKSLINFRRKSGPDLLLHKKLKRRRLEATKGETIMQMEAQPQRSRCSHMAKSVRCRDNCLPYTKYCASHILEDPLQIMYKRCNWKGCNIPVCTMCPDFSDAQCFCPPHRPMPEFSDLEPLMEKVIKANNEVELIDSCTTEPSQDPEVRALLNDLISKIDIDAKDAEIDGIEMSILFQPNIKISEKSCSNAANLPEVTSLVERNDTINISQKLDDDKSPTTTPPQVKLDNVATPPHEHKVTLTPEHKDTGADTLVKVEKKSSEEDFKLVPGTLQKDAKVDPPKSNNDETEIKSSNDISTDVVKKEESNVTIEIVENSTKSVIDSISTGQIFLASKSTEDKALHLMPLLPSLSSHLVPLMPSEDNQESCRNFLKEKGYTEKISSEFTAQTQQRATLDIVAENSMAAKVHHQGAVISVRSETGNEKTKKKISSTTLVPPLNIEVPDAAHRPQTTSPCSESGVHGANKELNQQTPEDKSMPLLAPLPHIKQPTPTIDDQNDVFDGNSESVDIDLAQKPHVEALDDDKPSYSGPHSPTAVSMDITDISEDELKASEVKMEIESISEASFSDSPCRHSPQDGDRKPSSADEEAAIASLLSLCGGTKP